MSYFSLEASANVSGSSSARNEIQQRLQNHYGMLLSSSSLNDTMRLSWLFTLKQFPARRELGSAVSGDMPCFITRNSDMSVPSAILNKKFQLEVTMPLVTVDMCPGSHCHHHALAAQGMLGVVAEATTSTYLEYILNLLLDTRHGRLPLIDQAARELVPQITAYADKTCRLISFEGCSSSSLDRPRDGFSFV
ncbi:hypothetical protein R1flu_018528 [Riccia fluitans]|uniref:Uncharacterized protein n=1 Tax=Riccia fluitans TaxID=41844 RepID=A0ABD1ZG39_9MARC